MREIEEAKEKLEEYLQSLKTPIYMIDFNTIIRKYEDYIAELKIVIKNDNKLIRKLYSNSKMRELKEVNKALKQLGLDDIHEYLCENKILSIVDLVKAFDCKTTNEIMLDMGALEAMGLIMVKYGHPIKFIAFKEEDYIIRYYKRFAK